MRGWRRGAEAAWACEVGGHVGVSCIGAVGWAGSVVECVESAWGREVCGVLVCGCGGEVHVTCGELAPRIWLGEAGRMPSSRSAGSRGILDAVVICGNAGPAEGTRQMSRGKKVRL